MSALINDPLRTINFAVLLQQQRYLLPITFLFYLYNGLTLSDFILFQGIFYFTCLFFEVPAGYLADVFPRKNILIFAYFLFLLRIILWLFSKGYLVILFGEILYGLSKAFYRGVSDGYIYDYLKYKNLSCEMLKKYGKFNCYMSFGSAISALLGVFLYKISGFKFLLFVELIINIFAIFLLMQLPNVPQVRAKSKTFVNHFKNLIFAFKNTLKNKNINIDIFYSAILVGVTSLFVWNFQPLMKNASVPVIFFGAIYFINHLLRGLFAFFARRIVDKFQLKNIGKIVWFLYFVSFCVLLFNKNYSNKYLCIFSLLFICFAIGIQMVYNVAVVSKVHNFVFPKIRATASSVNSMLQEMSSGIILISYKYLLNFELAVNIFAVFAGLFIISLFLLFKMKD